MSNKKQVQLSLYDKTKYHPGRNFIIRFLWYITNIIFFKNPFNVFSFSKVILLRIFSANIGKGVNIKPSVNIKYPWRLSIGNNVWIGENVWIDNLDNVNIGDNCCISQGAMFLTGSHDYTKTTFDVETHKIDLEEGVWIGARSIVNGGVICKSHSILGINSVVLKDMEAYSIYHGNPAIKISTREIK